MNKTFTLIGVGIVAASLTLAGATAANAKNTKTTICHATSSESNPWVLIEVAATAVVAHEGHGDLIPAPAGGCHTPVVPIEPPVDPPVEPPVDVPVDLPTEPVDPIEPPDEPAYIPPVVNCGEGTVPGWLNEYGDPTSCVDNWPCQEARDGLPCPGDVPVDDPLVVVPEPVEPTVPVESSTPEVTIAPIGAELPTVPVEELAYTGSTNPLIPAGFASLLLAAGAFLIRKAARA